jgi:RNA polymerase sigma-70 factor (ECF subfamily)
MELTDEQVLDRVRAGEIPLFEILMRRHNQRLFRAARAILRDDAESEDAVQQSWISAYTNLAQFAGQAKLTTWLTRIAIHEALARVRKRERLAERDLEGVVPMASAERSPEEHASGRELAAMLESAIDELPEAYRSVYVLREVQQLPVAETAECLDLSEENVKVRLHRAKAMLKDALSARVESASAEAFPFLGVRCDRIVARVLAHLQRRDS